MVSLAPSPDDHSQISTAVAGEIGENRAISELLARGHRVARPVVLGEDPVDLIVDYKKLVQVKTSVAPLIGGGYKFRGPAPPALDVFMLYALDINCWWIVPAEEIRKQTQSAFTVYLGPPTHATRRGRPRTNSWEQFEQWRERWSLLAG